MTTHKEALTLAREALKNFGQENSDVCKAIKEVLAQPEQEPVETLAYKADYWKRMHDEVRAELIKALNAQPEQEPVAIHQFRSPYSSDWYDGVPDHHDGHGPYEVRTLYTNPPQPKEPEQEPVARVVEHGATVKLEWANADAAHNAKVGNLYTTPPQRKPLTDDEIWKNDGIMSANSGYGATFETLRDIVRAIEAAHGIKE